jgi:cytochrome P450 family 710 subfamily A protein
LRQSFLTLFTRKALNVYLGIQEGIIRRSIDEWLAAGTETDIRFNVRDMNVETSQMVV